MVRVHWLEYRFRVLWADFTFFLDTGSAQRKQELAPSSCGHSGLGSWHLPERAVGTKGGGRSSCRSSLGKAECAAFPEHTAIHRGGGQQCQAYGQWAHPSPPRPPHLFYSHLLSCCLMSMIPYSPGCILSLRPESQCKMQRPLERKNN